MPAEQPSLPASTGFLVFRPGRMGYRSALDLQERLLSMRPEWDHDLLILLEHDPVVTAGRGTRSQHLLSSPHQLAESGIDYVETMRGGDVTYHGPGQLVGYPLLSLAICNKDLHLYLRQLEAVIIGALAQFGLTPHTVPGKTGVWLDDHKIASIGVAVRRWISWHGFAVNVANDLAGFETIVPCGLRNTRMTSMSQALGRQVDLDTVCGCIIDQFAKIFKLPCLGEFDMGST